MANITGTSGQDILFATAGNDVILGLDDFDRIYVSGGSDVVDGGDGDDFIELSDLGGHSIDGGAGYDLLSVNFESSAVALNFDGTGFVAGGPLAIGTTNVTNIEALHEVRGSAFSDSIILGNTISYVTTTINGFSGDDVLTGGNQNDTLIGGAGADTANGGDGDDTLISDLSGDQFDGGSGTNLLGFNFQAYTTRVSLDLTNVFATNSFTIGTSTFTNFQGFAYEFIGSGLNDDIAFSRTYSGGLWIRDFGGDNVISTGAGNDYIAMGGDGSDIVYANAGDDFIFVYSANADTIDGGTGTDGLYMDFRDATAGITADFASFVSGGVCVVAGSRLDGIETIADVRGSAFDDSLNFTNYIAPGGLNVLDEAGNDTVYGSAYADNFYLGTGNDQVQGGGGDDQFTINIFDGGDRLTGGTGNDTLSMSLFNGQSYGQAVTINFTRLWTNGEGLISSSLGETSVTGVETLGILQLTTSDDRVTIGGGYLGIVSMYLLGGQDNYRGGSGFDQVYAGAGNDIVNGWRGDDHLYGDEGNDVLTGGLGNDMLYGGAGDDIFFVDAVGDIVVEYAGEGIDSVRSIVSYTLSDDIENLRLQLNGKEGFGNALNNSIHGGAQANTLYGLDGDDLLYGESNDDILEGGAGHDTMFGGSGNDTLNGGDGDDIGRGDDGSDFMYLGDGDDRGFGSIGNDTIDGEAGADTLRGEEQNDILIGGAGNDLLFGDDGADTLYGQTGVDRLTGGLGRDVMTGGDERDVFILAKLSHTGLTRATADWILDFSQSDGDVIQLTGIIDTAFKFVDTAAFSGVQPELRYEFIGGDTMIYGDSNGDAVTDFALRLTGTITLTADDFIL